MAKMSISACSSPYLAPLAASARPYSSSCVFARHPVASFDQIRRGCCPPPAWLLPLACGCWKPPLHRGSQQLPLLSCFRRYTEPPFSSSLAPLRAAAHLFAGRPSWCPTAAAQRMMAMSHRRAPSRPIHQLPPRLGHGAEGPSIGRLQRAGGSHGAFGVVLRCLLHDSSQLSGEYL